MLYSLLEISLALQRVGRSSRPSVRSTGLLSSTSTVTVATQSRMKMNVGTMVPSKSSLQFWSHQTSPDLGWPPKLSKPGAHLGFVGNPSCMFRAFQTPSNSLALNVSKSRALSALSYLMMQGCFHERFLFSWAFFKPSPPPCLHFFSPFSFLGRNWSFAKTKWNSGSKFNSEFTSW